MEELVAVADDVEAARTEAFGEVRRVQGAAGEGEHELQLV